jgi:hypothetical protein
MHSGNGDPIPEDPPCPGWVDQPSLQAPSCLLPGHMHTWWKGFFFSSCRGSSDPRAVVAEEMGSWGGPSAGARLDAPQPRLPTRPGLSSSKARHPAPPGAGSNLGELTQVGFFNLGFLGIFSAESAASLSRMAEMPHGLLTLLGGGWRVSAILGQNERATFIIIIQCLGHSVLCRHRGSCSLLSPGDGTSIPLALAP